MNELVCVFLILTYLSDLSLRQTAQQLQTPGGINLLWRLSTPTGTADGMPNLLGHCLAGLWPVGVLRLSIFVLQGRLVSMASGAEPFTTVWLA